MSTHEWYNSQPDLNIQIPLLQYPASDELSREYLEHHDSPSAIHRKPLPANARIFSRDFRPLNLDSSQEGDISYQPHEINQSPPRLSDQQKAEIIAKNGKSTPPFPPDGLPDCLIRNPHISS
jgi:hypothetical protein